MDTNEMKASLLKRLAVLADAEKVTKATLQDMAHDLLGYVPETKDIDIVNRLIDVLTPINRKTAIQFFKHFLAWQVEELDGAFVRFTKMSASVKTRDKCTKRIAKFFADNETFWTWAEREVAVELKKKDFSALIIKAITAAKKGDEKTDTQALTNKEIVAAFFKAGISIADLMDGASIEETPEENVAEAA